MFVICSNFVRMSTIAESTPQRIRAKRLGKVKERLAGSIGQCADGFVILGRSKERSDARRP
ncbi:hypothetical protein MPLSOD_80001 [Mesorhizobium sp. SOD10]|nr:hypothetical protein MPLSOD_80001 [Mesorhizobium sp. SOD10]